jgi:hypothetical protein
MVDEAQLDRELFKHVDWLKDFLGAPEADLSEAAYVEIAKLRVVDLLKGLQCVWAEDMCRAITAARDA